MIIVMQCNPKTKHILYLMIDGYLVMGHVEKMFYHGYHPETVTIIYRRYRKFQKYFPDKLIWFRVTYYSCEFTIKITERVHPYIRVSL